MSEKGAQNVSNLRAILKGRAFKAADKDGSSKQKKQRQKQKQDDVAEATTAVGLKYNELTQQERQLFGSRSSSYIRARDKILLKWHQDCKHAVSLKELLDTVDDNSISVTRDAYYFLQENGYINFGVVQEPEVPAGPGEEAAATGSEQQHQEEEEQLEESEAAVVFKLYELLRAADMETTSEKALRKELQKHFKTDISEKKALVKEHVNYFIQHLEKRDTLEPKGYEGVKDPAAAAAEKKAKAEREAAAKAAAKAKRAAAAAPLPKPAGRVIVVGAGPAGLAAATLLQRNQVDVVVLEARDRVGGRVHSYKGSFSAPVDLGASLVTGTRADTEEGLAPDPVSFICKQLDIRLHELQGELPIYDAAGRKVAKDLDDTVDKLRDELLDAAGDAADEEGAAQQSLGHALQQALEQRLRAAAAIAADAQIKSSEAVRPDQQQGGNTSKQDSHDQLQAEPRSNEQQQQSEVTQVNQEVKEESKDDSKPVMPPGLAPKPEVDKQQRFAQLLSAAANASKPITADMLQLLDWHWANLEYGCSASLDKVSLPEWNQDEEWGGFGGPHCMVVGGFDQAMQGLAKQLGDKLHLSTPVVKIEYTQETSDQQQQEHEQQPEQQQGEGNDQQGLQGQQPGQSAAGESQSASVKVTTAGGQVFEGSVVLVTLPLGVLKACSVEFVPSLPDWKCEAVDKLGFGNLNKVVLQFPEVFWDDVDYFGITQPAGPDTRGRCFMFWNLARFTGVPLLTSLASGQSAEAAEDTPPEELVQHMLQALRRVHGDSVPEPVAQYVTRWRSDEYSRGSYSFVSVGCSGAEYDSLAAPVAGRLLFAGEHTCKEHPDTVGGAMLSGMREAARALHVLRGTSVGVDALITSRTATLSRAEKRKRQEEDEEEEYEVDDEPDDEAGIKKAKMQKKAKASTQREKKQKKERKKQKTESGADASDDDDHRQGAGRVRERRTAALTPAEMQSRIQAREHLRHDIQRLWKGLLDAQKGDVDIVLDVLAGCNSLDERQQCMAGIMKAQPQALQHLSESHKFLETLRSWLAELLPERSDANLHVTHKIMELMAKLRSSWAAISAVSGLMDTVRAASEHRNREVAQMGTALRKDWLSRNPNRVTQVPKQRRPSFMPGAATQQQQKPQQEAGSAGPSTPLIPGDAEANGAQVHDPAQLADLIDADQLQELEQAQAAVQAAKEQAEREAALLAAMQQEPAVPQVGKVRFDSFGEYKKVAKRQQQDAEDELQEQQGMAKRRKHHHDQQQRQHDASGGGRQQQGGDGGDGKEAATKELREYIKARLKPRFQAKDLDQEGCKWVLQKVQEKVLKNTTALESGQGGFVTGKRAKKVADLVDSYVDKRKAETAKHKKAAAATAGHKLAPRSSNVPTAPKAAAAAVPKPPARSKWDQPS